MVLWVIELLVICFTNWYEISYQTMSELLTGFYFLGVPDSMLSEFTSNNFSLMKYIKFTKLASEVANEIEGDYSSVTHFSVILYYLIITFGITIVIHLILMLINKSLSMLLFFEWCVAILMIGLMSRGLEMSYTSCFYIGVILPFIASTIVAIYDLVNSN